MTIMIDGHAIPATMAIRGDYKFPKAEILGYTGEGVAIASPVRDIEWTFAHMTTAEIDFWRTTVLGGAASKVCTNNVFNDPQMGGAEVAFQYCVLDAPEITQSPVGGYFRGVTIRIRDVR